MCIEKRETGTETETEMEGGKLVKAVLRGVYRDRDRGREVWYLFLFLEGHHPYWFKVALL